MNCDASDGRKLSGGLRCPARPGRVGVANNCLAKSLPVSGSRLGSDSHRVARAPMQCFLPSSQDMHWCGQRREWRATPSVHVSAASAYGSLPRRMFPRVGASLLKGRQCRAMKRYSTRLGSVSMPDSDRATSTGYGSVLQSFLRSIPDFHLRKPRHLGRREFIEDLYGVALELPQRTSSGAR